VKTSRESCKLYRAFVSSGANITALDQYATEAQGGRYFMRVEFELDHLQSRKDTLIQTLLPTLLSVMKCNGVWLLSVN
jgi:formyltetrahydrofolate hydrolase